MADPAYIDALVHYRTKFPTLASLGTDAATWKAELDSVTPLAFDPITGTSISNEGGSVAGVRNFAQMHKVRALYARRAELDASYTNPYTLPVSEPLAGKRIGHIVRIGY